jgi:hypothetical protein
MAPLLDDVPVNIDRIAEQKKLYMIIYGKTERGGDCKSNKIFV